MSRQLLHKPMKGAVAYCWYMCAELTRKDIERKGCTNEVKQCAEPDRVCKWIQFYGERREMA